MSCPWGKKKAFSLELAQCWAVLESCLVDTLASSSLVSRAVGGSDGLEEEAFALWPVALASSASSIFLSKPFPHSDVLFGLASSRGLEMDLVMDDRRLSQFQGGRTFICVLCTLLTLKDTQD